MATTDRNYVYLCAPVNALAEGIHEERIPFSEVRKPGGRAAHILETSV